MQERVARAKFPIISERDPERVLSLSLSLSHSRTSNLGLHARSPSTMVPWKPNAEPVDHFRLEKFEHPRSFERWINEFPQSGFSLKARGGKRERGSGGTGTVRDSGE